jgi:DNA polymerase III epsilon subunit-like protein
MNYNNICVFDFETSGINKNTCEVLQIGAAIVDRWNLEVVDTFNSLAKPEDMDAIEEEALQINRIKREDLEVAPDIKIVWGQFVNWVNKYNKSKGPLNTFRAAIPAGYNIIGYDMPIVQRYCKKFGPWDEKRQEQKLFNQLHKIDLMDHMFFWTENNDTIKSLKLTSVCEWMGFAKEDIENAHDALQDVLNTSKIVVRLLRMQRALTAVSDSTGEPRLQMKNAFGHGQE